MKSSTVEKAEAAAEKRENYGVKLSKVGKRCGNKTPVASFLTPNGNKESKLSSTTTPTHDYNHNGTTTTYSAVVDRQEEELRVKGENPSRVISARKLAALVWVLQQYKLPLRGGMYHHGGGGGGVALPRLRRHGRHQKGGTEVHDPVPASPEMPESSRRHITTSLMQHHHRSNERVTTNAIQPVSLASYDSSMEIAPYNPAVTPTSSIERRARTGEANLSLRTSTELLKVLNRIWSLEEQHISNITLVKALKKELDRARAQIKVLVREHQTDRQEIDELMKQISEDKVVRKTKEQDRVNASMNSMREELENERKLRKRSESLHRKLARELQDVKMSLSSVSKDLESEKKSRDLLEDLCNEFALGISKYGKELRVLRQESDRDWAESSDQDQLILHVSESWLDERMQMKLGIEHGFKGNKSVVEKLSSEIEAFLKAKRSVTVNKSIGNNQFTRNPALRSSLESLPLNAAVSAPQGDDDDDEEQDDSACSDSNCFELEKMSEAILKSHGNSYHNDESVKQKQVKKRIESSERAAGLSPSCLQVKFEEQMNRGNSQVQNSNQTNGAEQLLATDQTNQIETGISKHPEESKVLREERPYEHEGVNANDMIENLIRNHYMLAQSEKQQPDKDFNAASSSHWKSQPSPIRQWTEKLSSRGMSESSSSKLPQGPKENTLKAKLIEARIRGQKSWSRQKASGIHMGYD